MWLSPTPAALGSALVIAMHLHCKSSKGIGNTGKTAFSTQLHSPEIRHTRRTGGPEKQLTHIRLAECCLMLLSSFILKPPDDQVSSPIRPPFHQAAYL